MHIKSMIIICLVCGRLSIIRSILNMPVTAIDFDTPMSRVINQNQMNAIKYLATRRTAVALCLRRSASSGNGSRRARRPTRWFLFYFQCLLTMSRRRSAQSAVNGASLCSPFPLCSAVFGRVRRPRTCLIDVRSAGRKCTNGRPHRPALSPDESRSSNAPRFHQSSSWRTFAPDAGNGAWFCDAQSAFSARY